MLPCSFLKRIRPFRLQALAAYGDHHSTIDFSRPPRTMPEDGRLV
jgi:hypothetical protein